MKIEAARLAEIAGEADQRSVSRQFVALARTCKSCHDDFREK